VAEEAARILALPADKVLSIPNPRQSRQSSPDVAPEHERFFDEPVILGVGRLAPQKDFAMLLEAFALVARSRHVHLVVLGEGPEREALSQQAAALGVQHKVWLPGFVSNPLAYMRRARVFALSSRNEGFPSALVEAMEAGAGLVSTDCPFGPREILDGGRFGSLVPVGNASAFAAALQRELDRPDVGPDARRAERAEWMRQYDPEVITERYLELVRDVIAESETER
jgi:glycosyltransferase involved in cell wall biosynthesis